MSNGKGASGRMARAVGSQAPISRAEETTEEPTAQASPKPQNAVAGEGFGQAGWGRDEGAQGWGEAAATRDPSPRLVCLSVDVPADQHRRLRVMAAESGATGMSVIRALLAEMEDDADLAARVRDRLASVARMPLRSATRAQDGRGDVG